MFNLSAAAAAAAVIVAKLGASAQELNSGYTAEENASGGDKRRRTSLSGRCYSVCPSLLSSPVYLRRWQRAHGHGSRRGGESCGRAERGNSAILHFLPWPPLLLTLLPAQPSQQAAGPVRRCLGCLHLTCYPSPTVSVLANLVLLVGSATISTVERRRNGAPFNSWLAGWLAGSGTL